MKLLPEELASLIRDFLAALKTGRVQLNINQGRIESWEIVEHGRVKRSEVATKGKPARI
jgi:hypothetical protein